MDSVKPVEAWRETVDPALESKVQEFKMMGYNEATEEKIWECLQERVWKDSSDKRLYEVVQDIFHLGTDVFMNFLTFNAYTNDSDLMSSLDAVLGKK